eukprot:349808-Pyramimonas_sp.AAC.1
MSTQYLETATPSKDSGKWPLKNNLVSFHRPPMTKTTHHYLRASRPDLTGCRCPRWWPPQHLRPCRCSCPCAWRSRRPASPGRSSRPPP